MRKINFATKLSCYGASMALSIALFGSYVMFSAAPLQNVPEIPIINLDSITPNVNEKIPEDVIENNPLDTLSIIPNAGAGIARRGMTPTPPGVPPMPVTPREPGNVGYPASRELKVLGVLPPDVVILERGGKTITARSGSETDFGTVGEITSDGAYVDDTFIMLK